MTRFTECKSDARKQANTLKKYNKHLLEKFDILTCGRIWQSVKETRICAWIFRCMLREIQMMQQMSFEYFCITSYMGLVMDQLKDSHTPSDNRRLLLEGIGIFFATTSSRLSRKNSTFFVIILLLENRNQTVDFHKGF